jgi:hypothetical protein
MRLWPGQSRVRIPAEARYFSLTQYAQTGFGIHPVSYEYSVRKGCSLTPGEAAMAWGWPHNFISVKVKNTWRYCISLLPIYEFMTCKVIIYVLLKKWNFREIWYGPLPGCRKHYDQHWASITKKKFWLNERLPAFQERSHSVLFLVCPMRGTGPLNVWRISQNSLVIHKELFIFD